MSLAPGGGRTFRTVATSVRSWGTPWRLACWSVCPRWRSWPWRAWPCWPVTCAIGWCGRATTGRPNGAWRMLMYRVSASRPGTTEISFTTSRFPAA